MIIHVDIMIMMVKNQELFIIDVFQGPALLWGEQLKRDPNPPADIFILVQNWLKDGFVSIC